MDTARSGLIYSTHVKDTALEISRWWRLWWGYCPSILYNSAYFLILQQSNHFSFPVPDLLTINDQLTETSLPKAHDRCYQTMNITSHFMPHNALALPTVGILPAVRLITNPALWHQPYSYTMTGWSFDAATSLTSYVPADSAVLSHTGCLVNCVTSGINNLSW